MSKLMDTYGKLGLTNSKTTCSVDVPDISFELLNDGKWHFYFDFTTEQQLKGYLGIYVNSGNATIDFGDGTPIATLSEEGINYTYHEYSSLGEYRIDIEGDITITGEKSVGSYLWRPYTPSSDLPINLYAYSDYGLQALKFVEIPYGVTSIENFAFSDCRSLQSVNLPDGLITIGNKAFYRCYSFQSINIHNGLTSISDDSFNDCYSLKSINLPDGLISIGSGAFSGCYSLQDISIPDGVTSIGSTAFNSCYSLQSINIPDGLTIIGSGAFNNCFSLQDISIPDGVTSIGNSLFNACYALKNIKLPGGVTIIGDGAFSNCYTLTADFTAISLVNGVLPITIGLKVFQNLNATYGAKLLFANKEIADVAKTTTNLTAYANLIHYVGEDV